MIPNSKMPVRVLPAAWRLIVGALLSARTLPAAATATTPSPAIVYGVPPGGGYECDDYAVTINGSPAGVHGYYNGCFVHQARPVG